MPAPAPFNLEDLDPDARAMAEAAAKAAGLSPGEWISRFVLARTAAGTQPAAPPPPPAAEPPPPPSVEAPDNLEALPRIATTEDPLVAGEEAEPAHEPVDVEQPAAFLERDPEPVPSGAPPMIEPPPRDEVPAPIHTHAALSVVLARGTNATLSVGADSTTVSLPSVPSPRAPDAAIEAVPEVSGLTEGLAAAAQAAPAVPLTEEAREPPPAPQQPDLESDGQAPHEAPVHESQGEDSRSWAEIAAPASSSIPRHAVEPDSAPLPHPLPGDERTGDDALARSDAPIPPAEGGAAELSQALSTAGWTFSADKAQPTGDVLVLQPEDEADEPSHAPPPDDHTAKAADDQAETDVLTLGSEDEAPSPEPNGRLPLAEPTITAEHTADSPKEVASASSAMAAPDAPPAAANVSEPKPDLSHLFVETGGSETETPGSNRLTVILSCILLVLVTLGAWFYLSPSFDFGTESPPKLPPQQSVLKSPGSAESAPAGDAPAAHSEIETSPVPSPNAPTESNDGAQTLSALKEAADAGNGPAQHDLAVRYVRGDGVNQDYQEAARWFRAAALQGISNAQYNLGVLTERGLGVDRNLPMALLWYLAAAGKGHSAAEYNVGLVYAEGKGVEADQAEAMRWFRRSAERGFAKAQYNLGVMYERTGGDGASLIEAYRWYRLASAGGEGAADARLAEIKTRLGRADVDKAEELARQPLNPPPVTEQKKP
ncbi:MAG: hypothetical protein U1F33_02960 [Alphaproteobacteria bacterium]